MSQRAKCEENFTGQYSTWDLEKAVVKNKNSIDYLFVGLGVGGRKKNQTLRAQEGQTRLYSLVV